MIQPCCLDNTKLDLLRRLFASATHDASVAMRQWTDSSIRLTLDEVCEVRMENVNDALKIGDQLLTMVVLNLEGELSGELVLLFDQQNGHRLASSLIGETPDPSGEWSELEKSALTETGNIVACAYVSAITRLINQPLTPSVPYFIQDYGGSVLQQALMAQAVVQDPLMICRTGFHHEGAELNWLLVFVPGVALREAIENSLN